MDAAVALNYPNGLIGSTIEGRYRIDSVLAQGGMGTVFRATHLTLNRAVALKILRPDLESDQTQRFLREANIVAQLEHRNCVTVFDHGRSQEGFHFMAMQLLQGHVLAQELGTPMDPVRAASLLVDLMRGLEHAHARNVVHRDLKPDNLFLTTDEDGNEVIKLLDFGIAKFKQPADAADGAVTLSGLMAGTPAYMSPEQVIGADTDERTDLYSAGVMFYEMLAGHLPFNTDDPVVLLHHQLNEEFPPLPDPVPAPLQEIVRKMCNKEKAKRYPTASAVLGELEAFLYDATDGAFAMSSSGTRRFGTNPGMSVASVRGSETQVGASLQPDAVPGRPWWHWGVAAGLVLLAGGVAIPMVTGDDGANAASATATVAAQAATADGNTAADSVPANNEDRTGFLTLLAKVNDPDHPLPFDARKQSLQTLAGSEYASKVDSRLHTGLDLVQASESPTPCTTFHDALSEIGKSQDSYYVAYLSQAEVPERGPTESAEACANLDNALANVRKELIAEEAPQEEAVQRVVAASRSSKRRVARKKSRKDDVPEQSSEPVSADAAPSPAPSKKEPVAESKTPKLGPANEPAPATTTPKLPRKESRPSKGTAVTKLQGPEIRGL